MSHCVYVISARMDGPVKIGRGINPAKRALELQPGHPEALEVRYAVRCQTRTASVDLEYTVHQSLCYQRLMGEWFSVGVKAASEAIWHICTKGYRSQYMRFAPCAVEEVSPDDPVMQRLGLLPALPVASAANTADERVEAIRMLDDGMPWAMAENWLARIRRKRARELAARRQLPQIARMA